MAIQHIYWFAYYDHREPSVRYRGLYALQYLREHYGITYSIVYPGYKPAVILNFIRVYLKVLLSSQKGSLVVYENLRTSRTYSSLLKLLLLIKRRVTLYDIDDADYLRFPPASIHFFMKKCNACSVGSDELLKYSSTFNEKSFLLTSPVINHDSRKVGKNVELVIGWIGYYRAHMEALKKLIFPALKTIKFRIRLVILGADKPGQIEDIENYFRDYKHIVLDIPQNINWLDEVSVYNRIKEFDIGVSPLLDTEFNRTKSAFKMKQYLSCGVPVLASRVGENKRFLQQGYNGFFCDTPEDFRDYIEHVNEMNDDAYYLLSKNAVASAGSFSMETYCNVLMDIGDKIL